MSSLTHPADHSVAELKDELDAIDDPAELERLLEVERDGENRVTAIDAISQRLEAVGGADETGANEGDVADDGDGADETGDEMVDADDADGEAVDSGEAAAGTEAEPAGDEPDQTDDDAENYVEKTWSKDTGKNDDSGSDTTSLGRPTDAETTSSPEPPAREDTQRPRGRRERSRFGREESGHGSGRVEARIRQLQTEVSDLKAYRSALEEFLDEEGTGRQVLESLRAEIVAVEDDVAELSDSARVRDRDLGELWGVVGDVETELSQLAERLDRQRRDIEGVDGDLRTVNNDLQAFRETAEERHTDHADRLDELDGVLEDHAGALEEVDGEVTAVSEHVDTVAAELDDLDATVDERIEEGAAEREELAERIDENTEAIEALTDRVDGLTADVEALETAVDDGGRIDRRFDAVESEIQTLKQWREQLSSVLLGSGGDPNAAEQ